MNSFPFSPTFKPSQGLQKNLLSVVGVSVLVTLLGFIFAPQRIWANILLANYYLLGLGLAGMVFIAFQYVANAEWSVGLRRIPEAMMSVLPFASIIMVLLMLGIHSLYEWSHHDVVVNDELLSKKTWWLNIPSFVSRTIFYLGVWLLFAAAIRKSSLLQDVNGDIELTQRNKKYSALFLVVFGITISFASFDWIMSLEPHWYSTIFGLYNFTGIFLNGLAAMTLIAIYLKRRGTLEHILTAEHLHNLGKLIFAFSTFWMYLWFSQYMLIWYSNIPEETTYFLQRQKPGWLVFTLLNLLFNWVIPFVVLLPTWTKKNEGVLLRICIIIMLGHWLDLFWMILPSVMKEYPVMNVWEIAPMAGAIAAFFFLTFRALSKHSIVPRNDPYLVESLPQRH